jgi:hypothetical protein
MSTGTTRTFGDLSFSGPLLGAIGEPPVSRAGRNHIERAFARSLLESL